MITYVAEHSGQFQVGIAYVGESKEAAQKSIAYYGGYLSEWVAGERTHWEIYSGR